MLHYNTGDNTISGVQCLPVPVLVQWWQHYSQWSPTWWKYTGGVWSNWLHYSSALLLPAGVSMVV